LCEWARSGYECKAWRCGLVQIDREKGFSKKDWKDSPFYLSEIGYSVCVCGGGEGSLLNGKSIHVDRSIFEMLFSCPSVNYKTMWEREGVTTLLVIHEYILKNGKT
jgi:hypothetical protein